MSPWLMATLVGFVLGMGAGCEELRCCNACGRNYYLRAEEGQDRSIAWIANIQEGGDECEIDELPRTFEDARYTLRVTVLAVDPDGSGAWSYQLEVVDFAAGEDTGPCGSLGVTDAAALASMPIEAGTDLCVRGWVEADTLCTQKACALDS